MKSRQTLLALFNASEFAANKLKCRWLIDGDTVYLILPVISNYDGEILETFLLSHDIMPLAESPAEKSVTIREEDAGKLAGIIRKDARAWSDYHAIVHGIWLVIQASGYLCGEQFHEKQINYLFSLSAGISMLEDILPEETLIRQNNTSCKFLLSTLPTLTAGEKKTINDKITTYLEKFQQRRQITQKFLGMLPKTLLKSPTTMQDETLRMGLDQRNAAIIFPILMILTAIKEGELYHIPIRQFESNDIIDRMKHPLSNLENREMKLDYFIRLARSAGGNEISYQQKVICIRYKMKSHATLFNSACSRLVQSAPQENNTITCLYENIFALDVKAFKQIASAIQNYSENELLKSATAETYKAVYSAIQHDNIDSFIDLLTTHNININALWRLEPLTGSSMTILATSNGSIKILKWLIEHGSDIHEPMEHGAHAGMTPLYTAAHMRETAALEMLINYGADFKNPLKPIPAISDNMLKSLNHVFVGRPPIFAAVASGFTNAVRCFIQNGADYTATVTSGQSSGMTLMETAIIHQRSEVVELLIQHDANHIESATRDSFSQFAQNTAAINNNAADAIKVVTLLKDENSRMSRILAEFEKSPIVKDVKGYHWNRRSGRIYLTIPATVSVSPLLVFFLKHHGVDAREMPDKSSIYVKKSEVEMILSIFKNDSRAWTDFIRVIMKIDNCMTASSCKNIREINLSKISMQLSEACQTTFAEFLAQPFVKKTDDNKFEISMVELIHLPPADRIRLLVSLEVHLKELNKRNNAIFQLIEKLQTNCKVQPKASLENNVLTIKLNARSAALVSPIMRSMKAAREELSYIFNSVAINEIVNFNQDEIPALLNRRNQKMKDFIALTSRFGKRNIDNLENGLCFKFENESDVKRFVQAISRHTTTLSYDEIFDFDENKLREIENDIESHIRVAAHHNFCKTRIRQALMTLIPADECWEENEHSLTACPVSPQTAALTRSLGVAGLSVLTDTECSIQIDIIKLAASTIESFSVIEHDAISANQKLSILIEIICKVKAGKITYAPDTIVFTFKDANHQKQFESCCDQNFMNNTISDNECSITYCDFLLLDLDELKSRRNLLSAKLIPAPEIIQKASPSLQWQPAPNYLPRAATAMTTQPKNSKRKNTQKAKTVVPVTTSVKPRREYKGPQISPQKFRDHSILNKPPGGEYIDPKITLRSNSILDEPEVTPAQAMPEKTVTPTKHVFLSMLPACLFKSRHAVNYINCCIQIFQSLNYCIQEHDAHTATEDELTLNIITMEACIVELGRLYNHIKHSDEISPELKKFIKACHDSTNDTNGFLEKSLPGNHIIMLAENGADLWSAFINNNVLRPMSPDPK